MAANQSPISPLVLTVLVIPPGVILFWKMEFAIVCIPLLSVILMNKKVDTQCHPDGVNKRPTMAVIGVVIFSGNYFFPFKYHRVQLYHSLRQQTVTYTQYVNVF